MDYFVIIAIYLRSEIVEMHKTRAQGRYGRKKGRAQRPSLTEFGMEFCADVRDDVGIVPYIVNMSWCENNF